MPFLLSLDLVPEAEVKAKQVYLCVPVVNLTGHTREHVKFETPHSGKEGLRSV